MQSSLRRSSCRLDETPSGIEGVDGLTADQLTSLASVLHDQLEELHQRLMHDDAPLLAGGSTAHRRAPWIAADQHVVSIRAVNRAIAAIDGGTYGACVTCVAAIPFERLQTLPTTQRCVSCLDGCVPGA